MWHKMFKDQYLNIDNLISNPNVLKLFRVVEAHGGVLRFVGGAVRDAIAGIKGFDLDLATDLCEENGLRTIPIGIKFGTVGVLIDNQVLEVTSLRKDVKTDGRHAEVVFTSDWNEDASRRDLTINAVYADEKGNVRFIGSANQRIKEDYLRILRFFRFYSIFGKAPIDRKALEACKENRDGLKQLSMERIRDELFKLFLTPKVVETLQIMYDNEILSYVFPDTHYLEELDFLVNTIDVKDLPNAPLRRLFILYNPNTALAENLAARLRMSNKQREDFVSWAKHHPFFEELLEEKSLRRLVYLHGNDFCRDKLILLSALNRRVLPDLKQRLAHIAQISIPEFSVKGRDVIAAGIKDNRKIGEVLNELEQIWIDSDFSLSHGELLARLPELIMQKSA